MLIPIQWPRKLYFVNLRVTANDCFHSKNNCFGHPECLNMLQNVATFSFFFTESTCSKLPSYCSGICLPTPYGPNCVEDDRIKSVHIEEGNATRGTWTDIDINGFHGLSLALSLSKETFLTYCLLLWMTKSLQKGDSHKVKIFASSGANSFPF